jgi:hypothetical protein
VPAPAADLIAQLKDFADLKSEGILTEDEFEAQKVEVLACWAGLEAQSPCVHSRIRYR